jgi:regulator of sigma E protease
MEILIKGGQLLLSLSILVVLHELGHFIPAKLFKTRVEKFYLFFDWKFSLLKFTKGGTEYGIGWLPLGGYVKIAGMIDESMDKEQMNQEPQPWEFRSKPAWQRLVIMVGGVVVNVILAFFIYAGVLFTWGSEKLPIMNVPQGYDYNSMLQNEGLQSGDYITKVGDKDMVYYTDVPKALLISSYENIEVKRGNETLVLPISKNLKDSLVSLGNKAFIMRPHLPYVVENVSPGSVAENAGMVKGMEVLAFNDEERPTAKRVVGLLDENKGANNTLIVRNTFGGIDTISLNSNSEEELYGLLAQNPITMYNTEVREYTLAESFPAGVAMAGQSLSNYVKSIPLLFSKAGVKQIGGFASIGSLFSPTWDWESFWRMTAFISIILAVMNILPIPALDGGHVVFLVGEMITGRKPGEKTLEYAQIAGLVIIGALFIFANANDLVKFVF